VATITISLRRRSADLTVPIVSPVTPEEREITAKNYEKLISGLEDRINEYRAEIKKLRRQSDLSRF
jgi:hypothetical protein